MVGNHRPRSHAGRVAKTRVPIKDSWHARSAVMALFGWVYDFVTAVGLTRTARAVAAGFDAARLGAAIDVIATRPIRAEASALSADALRVCPDRGRDKAHDQSDVLRQSRFA